MYLIISFKFILLKFLGYLYGLEKFWAFLEYSGRKDTSKVDPVLKATLQRFKTVEDFRVSLFQIFILYFNNTI